VRRELFERLRAQAPGHVPALVAAAAMEHRAGNRARAEALYAEAAEAVARGATRGSEGLAPLSPQALAAAARLLRADTARGDGGALTAADGEGERGAGDAHGGNAALLHARAQAALREGDAARAEQHLAALEAAEPGNGYLCHTRGLLCQREGATGDAERWFRRGLRCRRHRGRGALLCYEALAELLAFLVRPRVFAAHRHAPLSARQLGGCRVTPSRRGTATAVLKLCRNSTQPICVS
jgi:hypothetical protein